MFLDHMTAALHTARMLRCDCNPCVLLAAPSYEHLHQCVLFIPDP